MSAVSNGTENMMGTIYQHSYRGIEVIDKDFNDNFGLILKTKTTHQECIYNRRRNIRRRRRSRSSACLAWANKERWPNNCPYRLRTGLKLSYTYVERSYCQTGNNRRCICKRTLLDIPFDYCIQGFIMYKY
uniref:Uncharacterized protein n=1 Tax=Romanomermis culicivorax TaxID=13658 RepID=A0A915KIG5_ROMCU